VTPVRGTECLKEFNESKGFSGHNSPYSHTHY